MISRLQQHRQVFAISMLMLGMALGLRAFTFTSSGLDWDESLYIVIAQRWLAGGLPYVAVWDQHPMGLPALFAAAEWLIGDGLLAARIACFLAVAGTAILLFRFMVRFASEPLAGVLAGVFYLFYMTRPEGLAANTEVFNNLIVTAASFLLLGEMYRPGTEIRVRIMFAAGLLLGIGLQIKYVVIPEAIVLCCAPLIRNWLNGTRFYQIIPAATAAVVGGLLPTILMTLYFWSMGALQPYLDGNLRANVDYLADPLSSALVWLRLRYGLLPLLGLLPWPFVLAWLWRDPAVRRRFGLLGLWLVLWLAAACIDVAIPLKLWKHYFNALIPPLSLLGGLTAVLLTRRMEPRRWLLAFLVATALSPAIFSIVKHIPDSRTIDRVNVPRAIGAAIRQAGTNGHDVYVFNYDSLVYAYCEAVPPTRFVLGIDLAEFNGISNSHPDVEIDRILSGRPRWIVVADPSPYIYPPEIWERLNAALRNYRVAAEYQEADYIQPPITVRLYQLADPAETRTAM